MIQIIFAFAGNFLGIDSNVHFFQDTLSRPSRLYVPNGVLIFVWKVLWT